MSSLSLFSASWTFCCTSSISVFAASHSRHFSSHNRRDTSNVMRNWLRRSFDFSYSFRRYSNSLALFTLSDGRHIDLGGGQSRLRFRVEASVDSQRLGCGESVGLVSELRKRRPMRNQFTKVVESVIMTTGAGRASVIRVLELVGMFRIRGSCR